VATGADGETNSNGNGGGAGGDGGAGSLRRYALRGPQVEPTAGLWLTRASIQVPNRKEVTDIAEQTDGDPRMTIDPETDFPTSAAQLEEELAILVALQNARSVEPYPARVRVGEKGEYALTPLSRFLQLQPVPFGTIFDLGERRQDDVDDVLEQHLRILTRIRVINEGQELARAFENETPGLFHRHALNWAFFNRLDISPPRQARVWMGLDMAIYTALSAAWYYKWLHPDYSRLLRPEEYDREANGDPGRLRVLFDRPVTAKGQELPRQPVKPCPEPTPGTPRHPAWPSGHSTYSAAASHMLEYFFSPGTLGTPDEILFADFPPGSDDIGNAGWIAAELRRLANNIGEARLWGGVHWLSDHVAGQKIGRAAAQAVINRFEKNCIPAVETRECPELAGKAPPTDDEIKQLFETGCDDSIPPRDERGRSFVSTRGGF
jgi:membrane-associated phospholipid phosphatase